MNRIYPICLHIIMINNIFIWIVKGLFFCKFAAELQPLIDVNLVLAQNIENLSETCVLIIIYKTYGRIVTCHQFFKQIYAPEYIFVF